MKRLARIASACAFGAEPPGAGCGARFGFFIGGSEAEGVL